MLLEIVKEDVRLNRQYVISQQLGDFLYEKTGCFIMRKRKYQGLTKITLKRAQLKLLKTIFVTGLDHGIQQVDCKILKKTPGDRLNSRFWTYVDNPSTGIFRYDFDTRHIRFRYITQLYIDWHIKHYGFFDTSSEIDFYLLTADKFEWRNGLPAAYFKYKDFIECWTYNFNKNKHIYPDESLFFTWLFDLDHKK